MKKNQFLCAILTALSLASATLIAQDVPASSDAAREAAIAKNADDAERQKVEALRRVEDARLAKEMQVGPPAAGEYNQGNKAFTERLRNIIRRSSGPVADRSLVIRSSDLDPKEQTNLEEDLTVMSHVLEKTLATAFGPQKQGNAVLGVDVFFSPGSNPIRGLYLDGYGALFTLNVVFPLVPAPKGDVEKGKASTDSAWDEARREVFGQGMEGKPAYPRSEEYDERKVNKLKEALLDALKNATHVRGLKSEDSVTLCVSGGPSMGGPESGERSAEELANLRKQLAELQTRYTENHPTVIETRQKIKALESQLANNQPRPRGTMLTIRVRKSDVDAFAKDKMSLDEFRKKARIMSYVSGEFSGGFGGRVGGGGGGFGGGAGF